MVLPVALLASIAGAVLTMQHAARARLPVAHATTSVLAIPLAGGPPRTLLRLQGQYAAPAGAPDGTLLLTSDQAVWRVVRGRPERVGPLASSQEPVWSPDRSRYVAWEAPARIVVRRVDGSLVRTLTRQPGIGGVGCSSWSGTSIACVRLTNAAGGWRHDLEIWSEDGTLLRTQRLAFPFGSATVALRPDGSTRVLHPAPFPVPQWTADGKTLVHVDRQGRLRANARVLLARPGGEFGLSADGRTVYVVRVKAATSMPK